MPHPEQIANALHYLRARLPKTDDHAWFGNIDLVEQELWKMRAINADLLAVAEMAAASQGWDGNNENEKRWEIFYRAARAAIAKAKGEKPT